MAASFNSLPMCIWCCQECNKLCLQLHTVTRVVGEWGRSLSSLQACFALCGSNKEPSNLTHEWNSICFSELSVASAQTVTPFSSFPTVAEEQFEACESCCLNKHICMICFIFQFLPSMPLVSLDNLFYLHKQKQAFFWPLHPFGCNVLLTVIAASTQWASWGWAHRLD